MVTNKCRYETEIIIMKEKCVPALSIPPQSLQINQLNPSDTVYKKVRWSEVKMT